MPSALAVVLVLAVYGVLAAPCTECRSTSSGLCKSPTTGHCLDAYSDNTCPLSYTLCDSQGAIPLFGFDEDPTYSVLPPRPTQTELCSSTRVVARFESFSVAREGGWGMAPEALDVGKVTHIMYSVVELVLESDTTFGIAFATPAVESKIANRLVGHVRKADPTGCARTIFTIGGQFLNTLHVETRMQWGAIASTPANRTAFATRVLAFARAYDFDGFDLNLEFPGFPLLGSDDGPALQTNLYFLFQDLRAAVISEAASSGLPTLEFTITINAQPYVLSQAYPNTALTTFVDALHFLTINFHGPWELNVNNDNSFQDFNPATPGVSQSVRQSLEALLAYGADPDKIVITVPAHARVWTLAEAVDTSSVIPPLGLTPSVSKGRIGRYTKAEGLLAYFEVAMLCTVDMVEPCNDTLPGLPTGQVTHDATRMAKLAVFGDQWMSYDDPQTMSDKALWIRQRALGGAMLYSADQDDFYDDFPLLTPLYDILYLRASPSPSPTPSISMTPTPSATPTRTSTHSPSPSATPTISFSSTPTTSTSVSPTPTPSSSVSSSATPSSSVSPSVTPSVTSSPSPTSSVSRSSSATPSASTTTTSTGTSTSTGTRTATPTPTPSPTPSPSLGAAYTVTASWELDLPNGVDTSPLTDAALKTAVLDLMPSYVVPSDVQVTSSIEGGQALRRRLAELSVEAQVDLVDIQQARDFLDEIDTPAFKAGLGTAVEGLLSVGEGDVSVEATTTNLGATPVEATEPSSSSSSSGLPPLVMVGIGAGALVLIGAGAVMYKKSKTRAEEQQDEKAHTKTRMGQVMPAPPVTPSAHSVAVRPAASGSASTSSSPVHATPGNTPRVVSPPQDEVRDPVAAMFD